MQIHIDSTNKELSAFAGLVIFKNLFSKAYPVETIPPGSLPPLKSGIEKSHNKFKQTLFGFLAGAECLEDLDRLNMDGGYRAAIEHDPYSSKSIGDFLRSYSTLELERSNLFLSETAFRLRNQLVPKSDSIILDIDSTSNHQYGKKMEGVAKNYNGLECLDTIQVFDELGLQYWHEVRPGNTHTSKNADVIIHSILSKAKATLPDCKRYVRADSGYCNKSFFKACSSENAQFVVCMRKLMYKPLIQKVANWEDQDSTSKDRIIFTGGRECQVGESIYRPKDTNLELRVVFIRSLKPTATDKLIKEIEDYDYQAWVSSISQDIKADQIIKIYRKRGHCENFIRELKNGMDLQHYPCQKLNANCAYGIIAAMAYNLMRFLAIRDNPDKPKFAKAIRFCFVSIPCQVVRHARSITFRFMDFHLKEVRKWLVEIGKMRVGLPIKPN